MGTYWRIENTKENKAKFKRIYSKHRKRNKDQFRDDFGHINSAEEVWDNGFVKVGVMNKRFYTKSFRDEIKKRFKIKVE
jgi:hypothetical protein